jgi:hypothetical protein
MAKKDKEGLWLYHPRLGIPKNIAPPCYKGKLKFGTHALRESNADRYGVIELPESFDGKGLLIEVGINGDDNWAMPERIVKQVWRYNYPQDNKLDVCIVLQPDGFVRTLWFNRRDDKHDTLDKSKYVNYNNDIKMILKNLPKR